jgi:hypothetical protein
VNIEQGIAYFAGPSFGVAATLLWQVGNEWWKAKANAAKVASERKASERNQLRLDFEAFKRTYVDENRRLKDRIAEIEKERVEEKHLLGIATKLNQELAREVITLRNEIAELRRGLGINEEIPRYEGQLRHYIPPSGRG